MFFKSPMLRFLGLDTTLMFVKLKLKDDDRNPQSSDMNK